MSIDKFFRELIFLLSTAGRSQKEPELQAEVPYKIESSELQAEVPPVSKVDLERRAFKSQLDSFGTRSIEDKIPNNAVFKHPLAEIKINSQGFTIPNAFAYSSLLINDAYLHPLVSNEQREQARSFFRSVVGEETFATMHPQLLNRQIASVMQACTLVSTLIEDQTEG